MTTTTDDRDRRLDALETDVRELRAEMNNRFDQINARIDQLHEAMRQNQEATNARLDRLQQETNRRLDRMFYTALGIGGAILVGLVVLYFRGG